MSDESFINGEAAPTAPEAGDTTPPEAVDTGASGDAEPPQPKTFTQEELDRIVGEAKAKAERKVRRELEAQAIEAQRTVSQEPPNPNQFKSQEEFLDAVTTWKAEQILNQREAQKQQVEVEATYAEREEDARAKYDDFERVTRNPSLRITHEMAAVIKASEMGPDIAYHLGSNPKEAARIAGLSPLLQAREIGKIEAALSNNPPPVKKPSSAPEPITPLGSRASTPNYTASDPRSVKMSMDDWAASRTKELIKRRQS